jgi:hypothetical protein
MTREKDDWRLTNQEKYLKGIRLCWKQYSAYRQEWVRKRKDADNVNKPTLDALKKIAYIDDSQVRSVTSTIFDKNLSLQFSGRVEYMGQLFHSDKPHVLLISIYSDSRLKELGGEKMVQQQRYSEWQRSFGRSFSASRDRPHSNAMQRTFVAKWSYLDKYCRDNPTHKFAAATSELLNHLKSLQR